MMLGFHLQMKEITVETGSVNEESSLSNLPISIRHQAHFLSLNPLTASP